MGMDAAFTDFHMAAFIAAGFFILAWRSSAYGAIWTLVAGLGMVIAIPNTAQAAWCCLSLAAMVFLVVRGRRLPRASLHLAIKVASILSAWLFAPSAVMLIAALAMSAFSPSERDPFIVYFAVVLGLL
jgi:hypothetical protein